MKHQPVTTVSAQRTMQRPKLALMVADAIAEEIFQKGLQPGVVLATESKMLEQFRVGRATLREALRLLEAEGLIAVRAGPNGGAVVQQPAPDRLARLLSILLTVSGTTLEDVLQARTVVEPELARRAALNADKADIAALDEAIETLADSSLRRGELLEESAHFHTIVATASKNIALSSFWFAIRRIADGQQVGVHYTMDSLDGSLRAHKKILEAIRTRDAAKAGDSMLKHITAHYDYLKSDYPFLLSAKVRLVGTS
jgi:DNA-binding FadR family transcriptional regulator